MGPEKAAKMPHVVLQYNYSTTLHSTATANLRMDVFSDGLLRPTVHAA